MTELLDRFIILSSFAVYLTAPALMFLLAGEPIYAAIAFLSPVGIILGIEAGLYDRWSVVRDD